MIYLPDGNPVTINSLKDLEKLLKLCRKNGIASITADGVTVHFEKHQTGSQWPRLNAPALDAFSTASAEESIKVPAYNGPIDAPEAPTTEGLTEEQLLNWSSQGHEPVDA